MLALSWVAALLACLGYGAASVLQSVGARRVAGATGVTGVARILTQGPYLAGLAADTVAFGANVVALQRLPLFLVQSVVSASVGVTALLAVARGARLRRVDVVLLAVLGLGVLLVSLTAVSDRAVRLPPPVGWAVLASTLLTGLVGLAATRLRGRGRWIGLAVAAGLGFSGVAVASRGLSADRIGLHLLANPLLWAVVAQGALALAWFALALQTGPVTTITAVTFVTEMVLPGAVGLGLLGDAVRPGWAPAALAGFLLAVIGTVGLARYAE